jgi:hypothetical protein
MERPQGDGLMDYVNEKNMWAVALDYVVMSVVYLTPAIVFINLYI